MVGFIQSISGIWYVLYVIVLVFIQLSLFGIVADRKRKLIQKELMEKRERDIESGEEAAKAAMADKQILDVMDDDDEEVSSTEEEPKKEEAPKVLVIGADGSDSSK